MNDFSQFHTDKINIIKSDGFSIIENIPALINNGRITVWESDLPTDFAIDDHDIIEQVLPQNRKKKYSVTDSLYKTKWKSIPAFYECKVEKFGTDTPSKSTSPTYYIHGDNSKIFNNSVDNSISNQHYNSQNLFTDLKRIIDENVKDNKELMERLEELEQAQSTSAFTGAYVNFISIAANHMTIIAPYLPQLAKMLLATG